MEYNIEPCIAIAVKVIIAVYILRKLWRNITNKELTIWKLLTPESRPDKKQKAEEMKPEELPTSDSEVIGATRKVFIEAMAKHTNSSPGDEKKETERHTEPEVTASIPLEYTAPEVVPDITEDDVEVVRSPMEDEEMFTPFENEQENMDDEFSTGMSYDQLAGAVNVLVNIDTADEDQQEQAAKVLYEVKNTDMFEFIASQVSNATTIDKLFSDFFDGNGLPKNRKDRFSVEGFDINAFV